MLDFAASSHAAELVLAVTALEFVALALWRWRRGRGLPILTLALMLAPGACLALALRQALIGDRAAMPVCLAAAGVLHIVDLARRWRAESCDSR